MNFKITLVGDRALVGRLNRMGVDLQTALVRKVTALAIKLNAYIVTQKLAGQVLNKVSGALARSISNKVEATVKAVYGYVFSSGDVKYAGIHEFGGRTSPHDIYPVKAKALRFALGGGGPGGENGTVQFAKVVHHPGSVMPERSFMRSGLRDMASEISRELKMTALETVTTTIHGRA